MPQGRLAAQMDSKSVSDDVVDGYAGDGSVDGRVDVGNLAPFA